MNGLTVGEIRRPLRREIYAWRCAALGLLALASVHSAATTAALMDVRERLDNQAAQIEKAEATHDYAVAQLEAVVLQSEADKQARTEQAAAYEEIGAYQYIGECIITSYCPCDKCCGQWADGLTATGIPAVPGIVAVDPDVIPLGSTVIIDGQRYLAADTGVTGMAVDICMAEHQTAEDYGVQTQKVWVVAGE